MKIIYLVMSREYDDGREPVAVFSTRQNAERYIANVSDPESESQPIIEVMDFDPESKPLEWVTVWHTCIGLDGVRGNQGYKQRVLSTSKEAADRLYVKDKKYVNCHSRKGAADSIRRAEAKLKQLQG